MQSDEAGPGGGISDLSDLSAFKASGEFAFDRSHFASLEQHGKQGWENPSGTGRSGLVTTAGLYLARHATGEGDSVVHSDLTKRALDSGLCRHVDREVDDRQDLSRMLTQRTSVLNHDLSSPCPLRARRATR